MPPTARPAPAILPAASSPRAPRPLRYRLEATLDPDAHTVRGRMRLSFTNTSQISLHGLPFHLYLNAFRDKNSVFMRESGGRLRQSAAHGTGRIDVKSLRVDGEERLSAAARELIPGDFTQLYLPLTKPLAPGASVDIESSFDVVLPPLFARAGFYEDFFAVAQWYPKPAKLAPSGQFMNFPYHALGEFYADFADFELVVRTPAAFEVGASGKLTRTRPMPHDKVERTFVAERVHDVAFFASPRFVRSEVRMEKVDVIFLAPPGYGLAQIEHENVVRRGLSHYAELCGAYPYPTLTVVIPPRGADGAAGMEYPSLIVTDGSWLPAPLAPSLSGAIVTAHELAHQWFYGVLASDELAHPVLDEGLSEWATLDLMRTMYGPSEPALAALGLSFDRFDIMRSFVMSWYPSVSPGRAAPFYSPLDYGTSVYGRAALALESVRRAHGKARFNEALKRYCAAQRFQHPTPDDLRSAFDEAYRGEIGTRVLAPLLFEGATSDVRMLSARTQKRGKGYATHVRARREGAAALPTFVAGLAADGRELARAAWPAGTETLDVDLVTSKPPARVVIDPDRALLTDRDAADQLWVLARSPQTPWLDQLIALAQWLLAWVGP